MITEEKANAYDEALERAREEMSKDGIKNDVIAVHLVETIFPELVESEDERIRKGILQVMYNRKDLMENPDFGNIKIKDAIAWLEKQKPISFSNNEDKRIIKEIISIVKSYRDSCITEGNHRFDDCISWLEKQGQKDKIIEDKDKLIKELGEYKVKYTQEVLEKHLNSMNNKDDERLRKTTISFLKDFAEQGYENAVECIDWLENHEQKPVEWSEEDEEYLNELIKYLNKRNSGHSIERIINWLEKLKRKKIIVPNVYSVKLDLPDIDVDAMVEEFTHSFLYLRNKYYLSNDTAYRMGIIDTIEKLKTK